MNLRRPALCSALVAVLIAAGGSLAHAAERHGISAFGDLKYAPDFKHFDYVNPDAPKGGRLSTIGTAARTTFDSLNGFILKGDAAQGLGYLFDSLMVRAQDEPDAVYGLVAKSAVVADDGRSVIFKLRNEARFSDGSLLTAADVAFSFNLIKEKGHPGLALPLRDVKNAEALDHHSVRFSFEGDQTRDLPLLVATLPIFSKAYYTEHDFAQTTLDPPLGSGPYGVGEVRQGRFISYRLRDDYWAKDLPVNVGRYNFGELRYEYFRDRAVGFEAFKAGEYDLREEFTSKVWATEYVFPAVKDKRVLLESLPDGNPSGAQGFFINMRKKKFSDPRVRLAIGLTFDFEWTNKNLFFGLYKRTHSYFENSEMKAAGEPGPDELALLDPYRDELDPAVFKSPYTPPETDGRGNDRRVRREASRLLKAAGWAVKNGKRVNGDGEALSIEFLIIDKTSERLLNHFVSNLKKLGIETNIRLVDPAQYQRRLKSFDFDMLSARFVLNVTPGVELRNYWSSSAAQIDGSANLSGIKSPVIDTLIENIVTAKTRSELVTATRSIDRVLRNGHYWVPHWYKASHTVAYWNKFSKPDVKPLYSRGIIETWWYDEAKAAKLKQSQ